MSKKNKCYPAQLLRNIDKRKAPKGFEGARSEKQRVRRLLKKAGEGKRLRRIKWGS